MLNLFLGSLFAAIPIYIIYCCVRMIRKRKEDPESYNPTFIYGAWQGHTLGTTTLEPGKITEIEEGLSHLGDKAARRTHTLEDPAHSDEFFKE